MTQQEKTMIESSFGRPESRPAWWKETPFAVVRKETPFPFHMGRINARATLEEAIAHGRTIVAADELRIMDHRTGEIVWPEDSKPIVTQVQTTDTRPAPTAAQQAILDAYQLALRDDGATALPASEQISKEDAFAGAHLPCGNAVTSGKAYQRLYMDTMRTGMRNSLGLFADYLRLTIFSSQDRREHWRRTRKSLRTATGCLAVYCRLALRRMVGNYNV